MKIGFASLVGLEPRPLDEVVAWTAANGFDGLEVNTGPGYPVIDDATYPGHLDLQSILADGPDETLVLFAKHGIEIIALAPRINLLTRDTALQKQRIEQMRVTIEATAALGCTTVVTFAGSGDGMSFYGLPGVGDGHESNRVQENIERFADVYGPLAELAEDRSARIAFETAGRGGGEGNIAHNPELWDAMFEAVPSPAIGLSFDPSHLVWLQIPDIPGLIRQYGARIYHFDAKDCEILPDQLARQGILGSSWWRYRLPGQGQLDWPAILAALQEIGYDFAITIEQEDPVCPGYECLAKSREFLSDLINAQRAASEVQTGAQNTVRSSSHLMDSQSGGMIELGAPRRDIAGPMGPIREADVVGAWWTQGYVRLEAAERLNVAVSFVEHRAQCELWYRLINLLLAGLDELSIVHVDDRIPLDITARESRIRLIAYAGGTSKMAFDATMSGYYGQSLGLIRHLIESFIQIAYARVRPDEAKRWFQQIDERPGENQAPKYQTALNAVRADADKDGKRLVDQISSLYKRGDKGAHPSKDLLGLTVGDQEESLVVGAHYKPRVGRFKLYAGTLATTVVLGELPQTEPLSDQWMSEFWTIFGLHQRFVAEVDT